MAKLPPRFVDSHERELHVQRRSCPETSNSSRGMWKEEIVGVEKDQGWMTCQRLGAVLCRDLASVRFAEQGCDPVTIARNDPS
jgi:hypothetical protein